MEYWTPEEEKVLRDNWYSVGQLPTRREGFAALATLLPLRSRGAIQIKATKLGLKKTKKYLKSIGRAK